MQPLPFQPTYMQIWTALLNRDYTGFEPGAPRLLRLRTPWATEQTYHLQKPIYIKLDMCVANVQKINFSSPPAFLILFWSCNMIFFK